MDDKLIRCYSEKYEEYMMDESRMTGYADTISFPRIENEVAKIIKELHSTHITIQGGKTGLTGGAVPMGGHLMVLSDLNEIGSVVRKENGEGTIDVGPGVTLGELDNALASKTREQKLFWPPRPTEPRATVGGVAALDAKGINACHYGDSRNYLESMHIVDSAGTVHIIDSNTDHEDLNEIIGAEGLLGPITRLTLRLLPKPESRWSLGLFFKEKEKADEFAEEMRHRKKSNESAWISAMEYMDANTLEVIAGRKPLVQSISTLPDVPDSTDVMVYVELEGNEDCIEELLTEIADLAEYNGCDPENTWAFTGDYDTEKMRAYRHAAPESINLKIDVARSLDGRIRKLGTDIEYPERDFREMVKEYRTGLEDAALYGCIFGGIYDSHMHVNIIPASYEEYERGKTLIKTWTVMAEAHGGNPSTEHGIGKIKQTVLTDGQLDVIRTRLLPLKEKYDPENIFNPGDIFSNLL